MCHAYSPVSTNFSLSCTLFSLGPLCALSVFSVSSLLGNKLLHPVAVALQCSKLGSSLPFLSQRLNCCNISTISGGRLHIFSCSIRNIGSCNTWWTTSPHHLAAKLLTIFLCVALLSLRLLRALRSLGSAPRFFSALFLCIPPPHILLMT